VADEIALGGLAAETGIEGLLLGDGGDQAAGVVVAWVEEAGLRKAEQLFGDRSPEGMGIALLEIYEVP